MRVGFDDCYVGEIAIIVWAQGIVNTTTNDLFLAEESNAITGPVVGIEMGDLHPCEIVYQRILLLIISLYNGYFKERIDSSNQ